MNIFTARRPEADGVPAPAGGGDADLNTTI